MPEQIFFQEQLVTPTGVVLLVTDASEHACALDWADNDARIDKLLKRYYPRHELRDRKLPQPSAAATALAAYFDGELAALDTLPVSDKAGTDFQRLVWSELRAIPAGQAISYSTLAQRIGRPNACRAVGLANGSNPVSIIVPCHRVIGSNASLTGYGGGLARKRWLLEHEGVELSAKSTRPVQLAMAINGKN